MATSSLLTSLRERNFSSASRMSVSGSASGWERIFGVLDVVERGGGRLAVDQLEPQGLEGALTDVDAPDAFGFHWHDRWSPMGESRPVSCLPIPPLGSMTPAYKSATVRRLVSLAFRVFSRCVTCSRGRSDRLRGAVGSRTGMVVSMVAYRHPIHGIIQSWRLSTNTTPDGRKCWRGKPVGKWTRHSDGCTEMSVQTALPY